jgi:hypothetical protein
MIKKKRKKLHLFILVLFRPTYCLALGDFHAMSTYLILTSKVNENNKQREGESK